MLILFRVCLLLFIIYGNLVTLHNDSKPVMWKISVWFGFKDANMEKGFQKFRIITLYDQIKPIIVIFWIPVAVVLHVATFSYRSCYSKTLEDQEILIFRVRLALLLLSMILFFKDWGSNLKYKIGYCVPWMNRAFHFIIANEQANTHGDDLFSMTTFVYLLTMSGLKTSTYCEFFLGSVGLVLIRPCLLICRCSSLSDQKNIDIFWQASYENCILFIFGLELHGNFKPADAATG